MFLLRRSIDITLNKTTENLHSNMFLLRHRLYQKANDYFQNLHSNMFLLRLAYPFPFTLTPASFTFQYVSIKTKIDSGELPIAFVFTFQYVSIKTYTGELVNADEIVFTFQYVSIKTYVVSASSPADTRIYIPICFY